MGIQYTGYEAHPKAGAFKGGFNNLTVEDLVNAANTMYAIDSQMNGGTETWEPWEVKDGPLPMGDIYNAELKNGFIQFVSPGGGDADLKFATEGAVGEGELYYQGENLGRVYFELTKAGLRVSGHLMDYSLASASFEGADVDISVALNDLPPRFVVKTGFSLGAERVAVDIELRLSKQRATVTFPNSIKELAKTSPEDVVEALRKLEDMDVENLVIRNPQILAGETVQWGAFVLEQAAMRVVNEAGQLKLKVSGEKYVYGSKVAVEGEYDGNAGEFILRSKVEGNYALRELNFAYASTELHYDGDEAWARATGRVGKGNVSANMVLEIPNPEEGRGRGEAEIQLKKGYAVQGAVKLHHDSQKTEWVVTVDSGANMNHFDLSGLDLSGFVFDDVNLSDCNMMDANFTGASFRNATIVATNLDRSNYTGADFTGADMTRSAIPGATFTDAILEDAVLKGVNMVGLSPQQVSSANAVGAIWTDVRWQEADLSGLDFSGIIFNSPIMHNATLQNVNFSGAQFNEAQFQYADMSGAILNQATMVEAECTQVNFSSANLEDADLSKARLSGANLDDVKASRLKMNEAEADGVHGVGGEYFNAVITYCNMSNGIWDQSNCTDATVQDIDFTGSSLDNTDFTRALCNTSIFNSCRLIETRFYGANLGGTQIHDADWEGAVLDGDTVFANARLGSPSNLDKVVGLGAAQWEGSVRNQDFDPGNPGGGGDPLPKPDTPW